MARKGKKKRNKKTRPYNKKQFTEIFCVSCGLCDPKNDPSFCYIELYKHEPKEFVNAVWRNLQDVASYMRSLGRPYSSMSMEQFQNIFCITGICWNRDADEGLKCDNLKSCYEMFREQMGAAPGLLIHENRNIVRIPVVKGVSGKGGKVVSIYTSRRKRKGKRYIANAYPTFFSSKNPEFQEAVKKILYGNNNLEQDKDKESTGEDKDGSSGSAKAGQSEVS